MNTDMSIEEYHLEHYGKKGMRWGQRKAAINGARDRTENAARTAIALSSRGTVEKGAARQRTMSEIQKVVKETRESGDLKTAAKATKGEKLAGVGRHGLIFGPAVATAQARNGQVVVDRILEAAGALKYKDFDTVVLR